MTEVRDPDKALNRSLWAVINERFTDAAAEDLWSRPGPTWGLFAVPEQDLDVLGPLDGLDVVELACGYRLLLRVAGAGRRQDGRRRHLPRAAADRTQDAGPGRTGIPSGPGGRGAGPPGRAAATTSW